MVEIKSLHLINLLKCDQIKLEQFIFSANKVLHFRESLEVFVFMSSFSKTADAQNITSLSMCRQKVFLRFGIHNTRFD